MTLEEEKRKSEKRWWNNIYPVGAIAVITPWVMYPIAELFRKYAVEGTFLWYWLDDEITDPKKNADWLEYKVWAPKWLRYYLWHCARNSMWNWKASKKPASAAVHCKKNEEEIVEIVEFDMELNGRKLEPGELCINMPVVRWIDRAGNQSWNTLSGHTVNNEKTIWGRMKIWYRANGELLFREGFVKQKYGWMMFGKFPFIGKRHYYHIVAKGSNEKRFIYTNKRQLVPFDQKDLMPERYR